ncbi:MAG: hypothetical protein M3071_01115 [Actinomycetota bacterium]|nr:hypothetical protein [Actinomycetota bacterium]
MPYNLRNSTLIRQTPQGSPGISDRARLLHALDAAEGDALTIGDLRERGIEMPGQAIYELEVDGYPVERVSRRSSERRGRVLGCRLSAQAAEAHDRANARRDV